MKIGLLNGPNLNLLGVREPHIYGHTTLAQIESGLRDVATAHGAEIVAQQSNSEGALIDALHAWRGDVRGVIVNAGALTHTSLALRDAFTATSLPFIEVHLSNIYAREPERRHSMLAPAAIGLVCGLGVEGYEYALRTLLRRFSIAPAT